METGTVESDMGIGLTMVFSVVALLGAVAMYAAPGQEAKAWGFAVAMLAATCAVIATQVYGA
jgi:hypothetical protein